MVQPLSAAPEWALSVRQPLAWAILHAGKDVENRSRHAVDKGIMSAGKRLCIHASGGMTRDEYEAAKAFMFKISVKCPPPASLIRGAIIGEVDVVAIVKEHNGSPWWMGPRGLLLANPLAYAAPIPVRGALGYFKWLPDPEGGIAPVARWMAQYGLTPGLFPARGPTQRQDSFL